MSPELPGREGHEAFRRQTAAVSPQLLAGGTACWMLHVVLQQPHPSLQVSARCKPGRRALTIGAACPVLHLCHGWTCSSPEVLAIPGGQQMSRVGMHAMGIIRQIAWNAAAIAGCMRGRACVPDRLRCMGLLSKSLPTQATDCVLRMAQAGSSTGSKDSVRLPGPVKSTFWR